MIGATLQDRYTIETELGRGGMGTVYRAQDQLLERPVAIKVVSAAGLGTEGRVRLMQEARAAARLNHPNIVTVHDVGTADLPDQREPASYIVMELVDGQTLRECEGLSLDQVIDITSDICRALETAHELGIVHRDLKPENVALTSSGSVKLMDFGLAWISGGSRLTEQGTVMGTLSYLAPEIILGQPASSSSDLYALGVMMYEMSAGRPPFEGGDLTAVLSQHLHAPVTPPGTFNDGIPPILDDLIVRLLGKRPEDRPASAGDARLDLEKISLARSGLDPSPAMPEISRLVRGRLIGREEEFDQAVNMWRETAGGRGQFLFISGEPGIGKTRLVRELSTYAEISGGQTLVSNCYAQERTPYGPIAQMVESSLQNGAAPVDLPAAVLADLLTLVPELRLSYPDLPLNERLDQEAEQRRMFESIVTWFAALTRNGRVMLVVDDVHWADSGSIALLRYLARRLERRPALIVATYREVELDESLPFRQLLLDLKQDRLASRIKLNRLDKAQTGKLLSTLFAEEITPDFLDSIFRETEGNPFFVEEVCKALVDSGELYFEDGRWQRPDMEQLDIPQGVKLTIQSRLSKLSGVEQKVLQIAALLGRDFEYEMLAAISELDEDSLIGALENCERAQMVEEIRRPGQFQGTLFSFTHALIHSTLLTALSNLRRQRRQRRMALALEAAFPERRRELAPLLGRYFAEAGDADKSVSYLLMAGDDARGVFAYDEAVEAYEQALLLLREQDDHNRTARTLMKLGLVYHNNFAFEQSRQAYTEAFDEWRQVTTSEQQEGRLLPEAPHAYRTGVPTAPPTLDPAEVHDSLSFYWIRLLFSGLVELTPDDDIVPDVARRWDVLDGGTRYVFHLREDVHWSDGTKVTAGDFEYGIRRVLAPTARAGLAGNLYDIKGAEAFHNGRETDPNSVGIKALDDATLEIRLAGPSSYFLQILALPNAFAVPEVALKNVGETWPAPEDLVTNGPFRMHTWRPDERLVAERYPDYHGRYKGNVSQIDFSVGSLDTWLERYESGAFDLVYPFVGSMEEGYRAIQAHPDEYVTTPAASTVHLTFDVTRPPFDDARVRRALALSVDLDDIISRTLKGVIFPALGGFVPPGLPGHVPGIGRRYDPPLARQKLAEAGYPGGAGFPAVELVIMESDNSGGSFDIMCQQWVEHLGIEITLQETDFNTLLRMQAGLRKQAGLGHQLSDRPRMWVVSWGADYPDPDNFLRVGSWRADGGWHNREYEISVDEARRITDPGQRMAMYQKAERIMAKEVPIIPLGYGRNQVLLKPWVTSWPTSAINGTILKDVVIEPH